ncbi:hypothetical protein IV102_18605 [bacterium]|nr:hypothetical protein [bacterium]
MQASVEKCRVDKFIHDAVQSGQFDSTGQFSIDVRQALAKGIRLADPEEFVLLLVSWASQSGASRVVIRLSRGQVLLDHNGQAPSLAQLDSLIQNFVPGSTAPIRSLALAVLGALQANPRVLAVEVAEGSWTPQGIRRQCTGKNFHVRVQLPFFQRFQRVESLLLQRCLHSRIAIELNQKPLNRPFDLSANLGSLALRSSQAPLPDFRPAPHHHDREWDEEYSLILGTDRGDFETQIHGVASQQMAHRGMAIGNRFGLDASLLRAVDNPQLRTRVAGLWLDLASSALLQPASDLDRLGWLQEEVGEVLLGQGESDGARSVLAARLALARQRSQDAIPWLHRLAQLEQQCAHFEEALSYWQQAYQLRHDPANAEGILLCLCQAPPQPPGYREPLQTLLRASRKSDQLETICDWLWTGQQWPEALECHREWLPTLKDPSHCLKRLVALTQRLGRKLEEENYRILASEWAEP